MRKRILIFATGGKGHGEGGSGARELIKASRDGRLEADIVGLVSNYPEGGVFDLHEELGIPFRLFSGPFTADEYQKIMDEFKPDLVCLSGWLKQVFGIDPRIIINIHPGILPLTAGLYGHLVHEKVMEAFGRGEIKETAVTMHFVTAKYDDGPIIFEKLVAINATDTPQTLAKRVNDVEHIYQPLVTNAVINEAIHWDGVNKESLVTPPWCLPIPI